MHPTWITLCCLASLLAGMGITYAYRRYLPQHTGAGDGAPTVWQLIEQIEAEAAARESTGRHRLRESDPQSTSDDPRWPPEPNEPPLDLQHRVLDGLYRI
jgi:hypothetical protein